MDEEIKIELLDINKSPEHFQKVIELWRSNSKTLGFFTLGAFEEYAIKKQIFIALYKNVCVGYLLYRVSKNRSTIVHLCVDSNVRGRGIAKLLFDELKEKTKGLHGIILSCRRDYDASSLWPRLGFVGVNERIGRSYDGKPLTLWWYDHKHPSLFSELDSNIFEEKIPVVIDANIFFDLDEHCLKADEESKSLTADWIQETIILCLTDEIYNEINRCDDGGERNRQRQRIQSFKTLSRSKDEFEKYKTEIRLLYPDSISERDESDIRQVSRAIAEKADFFITRDNKLLSLSDIIYEKFGISVLRPAELIIHIDYLQSESDYNPKRLAGSLHSIRKVKSDELNGISEVFQAFNIGETLKGFKKKLASVLSDIDICECIVALTQDDEYLGLIGYCKENDYELEIPLIRVVDNEVGHTLTRYLLNKAILQAVDENKFSVKVTDRFLTQNVETALYDTGYFKHKDGYWSKLNFPYVGDVDHLVKQLGNNYVFSKYSHELQSKLINTLKGCSSDSGALAEFEKMLWPVKVESSVINNLIMPIMAGWARDLFDENLADNDLFGGRVDLALQQEGIYYKSLANSSVITAPARLLWYISLDKDIPGSGCIRACSQIDDVVIGKPKELFKRYRKYGVYEWKEIYKTANNDINNNIVAVKFSHTELFKNPICWADFQNILKSYNIKTQIQSPTKITQNAFIDIYRKAQNV